MNRIFYYNITYRCNQNCVFCFSNSTCSDGKNMDVASIIDNLHKFKPDKEDLIVLNGGEPSVHPLFYDLLHTLQSRYQSELAIYSNGSMLNISELKEIRLTNTFFVIPIHGNEALHDRITQTPGSFQHSLSNIKSLSQIGCRYKIKFIVNDLMISENFNISDFLVGQNLCPEEIIIARLNGTAKSKKNNVILPTNNGLVNYLQEQLRQLHSNHKIKLLDFPPCYINECSLRATPIDIPVFYFNDASNSMEIRPYYKEIPIGLECSDCANSKICKTMKNSYLTLSLYGDELLLERE